MPLRKMKQKKFRGIYEYYKASDHDKATTAYYINARGADGKSRKIKVDASTAEEAVIALAQHKSIRKTTPALSGNNAKTTVNELASKFFGQRTSANNDRDKRRYELHIKPVMGTKTANSIAKKHMLDLQEHLQKKLVPATWNAKDSTVHLSPKTINSITDIAYRLFNWAHGKELITKAPLKIDKFSVDNERQRVFTRQELDAIFDATEGDTFIFLTLAYHTAQRPQSIIRLQKKHIVNGSILIESIKHQTSHKIPISTKLQDVLLPWIEDLKPSDYIITKSLKPLPYQTIQARISKLFGVLFNAGLDYRTDSKLWASLYTLRHTALTNIYENTEDIYAAQSIANHSSIKMTQRYAKGSEKLKRNALEGL